MTFRKLFQDKKPIIGCIHLDPLPGAPAYGGSMEKILETALREVKIYRDHGIDGLIVENFRDMPFYPDNLPPETIAAMAVITHSVKSAFGGPVGVNALRNDALGALAIAVAGNADFIRVNVHTGASLTDQGIIQGRAHETLRARKHLNARILILADVRVKHATPIGNFSLEEEVKNTLERGLADGIIVSGKATGASVKLEELEVIRKCTTLPVLIGSGTKPGNLASLLPMADGFIVGSYFKRNGLAANEVDRKRVKEFTGTYTKLTVKE